MPYFYFILDIRFFTRDRNEVNMANTDIYFAYNNNNATLYFAGHDPYGEDDLPEHVWPNLDWEYAGNWSDTNCPWNASYDYTANAQTIEFLNTVVAPEDVSNWFREAYYLTNIIHLDYLDISNVTNMSYMFADCENLTEINISTWQVSTQNVNLTKMFYNCTALQRIYCNYEWSATTTPDQSCNMFENCTNLIGGVGIDQRSYDSHYIDGSYANYRNGYFTLWGIFWGLNNNHSILYLANQPTVNTQEVFCPAYFDEQTGFVTPEWLSQQNSIVEVVFETPIQPINTYYWFRNCSVLCDFTNWSYLDMSNVIDTTAMFEGCSTNYFNPDFSNWNVSNVKRMGGMFAGCSGSDFEALGISNWDVSNVTDMRVMFAGCNGNSFTELNLNNWNVSNVTNMNMMFYGCEKLTTIYCNTAWTPESSNNMFYNCGRLVGENNTGYSSMHDDASYAKLDESNSPGYFSYPLFYWGTVMANGGNSSEKMLYLSKTQTTNAPNSFKDIEITARFTAPWDSEKNYITGITFENIISPKIMQSWFSDMKNVSHVVNPLNLKTNRVITMLNLFAESDNSSSYFGLENWDVSNVEIMSNMFMNCDSNSFNPNIANWNISSVADMSNMFRGCSGIGFRPDFSKWNNYTLTNMKSMFCNCNNLESLDFSSWGPVLRVVSINEDDTLHFELNCDTEYLFQGCGKLKKIKIGNETTCPAFLTNCGLPDANSTGQETPNLNGSRYSGKWIRTKTADGTSDTTSIGMDAEALFWDGSDSSIPQAWGTYEWEVQHPIYYIPWEVGVIRTEENTLKTDWITNGRSYQINIGTVCPIKLYRYYDNTAEENSFDTYNYPISNPEYRQKDNGSYIEYTTNNNTLASVTEPVTIEMRMTGDLPNYPAEPTQKPEKASMFKGWMRHMGELSKPHPAEGPLWILSTNVLYAIYDIFETILEEKVRDPNDSEKWITLHTFYQDEEGNVYPEDYFDEEEQLTLNYEVTLQDDGNKKSVQIAFPQDDFTITVGEPATQWTTTNASAVQLNFGDSIKAVSTFSIGQDGKIENAIINSVKLPVTPVFNSPVIMSATTPSSGIIWLETI